MDAAELQDEESYTPLLKLHHDDIIGFVQSEFSFDTRVIRFYLGLNIAIFLFMLIGAGWQIYQGLINLGQVLAYTGWGLLISLTVLIPIHEWIHGIAYRLAGAPRVTYRANLRKFYFYAVADRFVLGPAAFRMVALAPFVLISFLAVALTFYVSLNYQWLCWGVLLMHTGACAGDFGLLSFYDRQPDKKIFTYDDVAAKVTYFYYQKATG